MPLKDFLKEGEEIKYRSPLPLEHLGRDYLLVITDSRILFYCKGDEVSLSPVGGIVPVRKDTAMSEELKDIKRLSYSEKGLLRKKGIIEITGKSGYAFSGHPEVARVIHRELKRFLPGSAGR